MSRKPIANPLLDVDGYIDPVNLINPYAYAAAGFNPASYGTPVLWLVADDISGVNDDPVGTWPKNTYGSDATGSSTARPLLKTSSVNGHNSILFDGSDDELNTGAISFGSLFIVAKYNAANFPGGVYPGLITGPTGASADILLVGNTADTAWFPDSASPYYKNGTLTTNSASNAGPMNAWTVMYGEKSGSFAIKLGQDRNNAGRPWSGPVAEVLMYSGTLSSGNREAVEDYLGDKYGITITH